MKASVFQEILNQLNQGESADLILSAEGHTYIRRFCKTDRLILLGGGHVSMDVYRLARSLEFDVFVVDDRPLFANHERFPEANVICDDFTSAIRQLHINKTDYVCVLTRGHRWDAACIRELLRGEIPYYIGLISSRRRAAGMRDILLEEGFNQADIDSIHAPIGLPIGAMTTAEIAVSICAELIQIRSQNGYAPRENELVQTNVDFELLDYLANTEEPRAVVTVLSSQGSTPVKSGSMMAVDRLGAIKGTVGGGCGEAAAINKARILIGTDQSAVMTFDMTNEVAAENDMVCGGSMTVLIEDIT